MVFVIEGSSVIDNASTNTMKAVHLGNGAYSNADCKLKIRPNAKLTVRNAGIVFRNVGTGSLDLAGGRGNLEVDTNANFMLETNVNLQNNIGWTALMLASINSGKDSTEGTVKMLLEKGANVNLQNNNGETAFMLASGFTMKYSTEGTVEMLLEKELI